MGSIPAAPATRSIRAARTSTITVALLVATAALVACAPDRPPPSPNGVVADLPDPRPTPDVPTPTPEPDPPPGPWPVSPPPAPAPGPPHPLDPAPLPDPWPVGAPIAGVDFERRVIADEAVVGLAATDRGIFAASASGGLFVLREPSGFVPLPTALPPLRGLVGGGDALVACPADGAPARIELGDGWARLDVGCNPDGRRTVAIDKQHGYLLVGQTLRDGRWPALSRRRPAPVAHPLAIGAEAGRVVVIGRDAVAASDDAGATFTAARRPERPAVVEARDVALTGKGRAVMVGRGVGGQAAIEFSRDGGRTWRVADGPDRLADDLAAVIADARGVFYAVPRVPGPALRSDDGGGSWRALDPRLRVHGALLPASAGAWAGASSGLVLGLDRQAPRGPALDRPLWRAVFTHPRIGVGVGVLGGIWRTLDGGRRWFAVPGTAGLPFTDLDRIGGHGVVAVGEGLFRRSDDAGARWTAQPPPGSCQARWVRFFGATGLADCEDGRPAISDDGGSSWDRAAPAPLRAPPVWLDEDRAAVLALDGRIGWCAEGATICRWHAAPADVVELAAAPEAISAVDRSGRIWRSAGPDSPWQQGPDSGIADPVAHQPLADGRVVLIDDDALYMMDRAGHAERLGPVPDARALVVPGDGSLLVLQAGATTLFEAR